MGVTPSLRLTGQSLQLVLQRQYCIQLVVQVPLAQGNHFFNCGGNQGIESNRLPLCQ